jgi:hypothetical protein
LRATRTLRFRAVTIKGTVLRVAVGGPVRWICEMSYVGVTV